MTWPASCRERQTPWTLKKRPIVVIDPRAGNGPGIGGSKQDSEIGDALAQGHPVYFIIFHPEPVPGQTLEDVEKAEIRLSKRLPVFIRKLKNRR